ncbi:MAG: type II toxin-antitoxin system mRNA interferase toxin, RelE/StbE family [Spirochaetota bacterium]
MVPKIVYTQSYIRRAKKFIKYHPELLKQYKKTLKLLEVNPTHPSLRLHKLGGKLEGMYSASINISYRISLEFIVKEDKIIPINIGSHEETY